MYNMKALSLSLSLLLLHVAAGQIYLLCDDFEFTTEDSCSCYNPHQPIISCPSAGLTSIPNITRVHTLQLNNNNLTSLRAAKLSHLTGLSKLEIIDNQISHVSVFAFSGVEGSLELLDLSGNRMEAIPAVFGVDRNQQRHGSRVLTKLDVLTLSHNYLHSIKKGAFQGTPNLTELHLEENYIYSIKKNAFKGLSNLRELHLEGNPVSHITPEVWMGPRSLRYLALTVSNTDISRIPTRNLHSLTSLHIHGAKPMRLDFFSGWLKSFPQLQHLSLDEMGLEDIHLYKGSFPSGWKSQLLSLSLRGNKLTKIPYDLISQLSLQELDLSGNVMKRILYYSAYENVLRNLSKINLGNNLLSAVRGHFLMSLHRALVVDLRNNYLTTLPWRINMIDENMHPQAVLLLGGNLWDCRCEEKWLKQMVERELNMYNGRLLREEIYSDLRCGPGNAVYSGDLVVDVPRRAFCISD